MKLSKLVYVFALLLCLFNCKSDKKKDTIANNTASIEQIETIKVKPVNHGTLVLESQKHTFYIDPVGAAENFSDYDKPNYILITDIHGDHLNLKTLKSMDLSKTTLIAPKAAADKLSEDIANSIVILNNGENYESDDLKIEAIPMYNLRKEALKFHPKGRGNGYVISVDNQRIYISGDTEDIPEMRQLKNINIAFICMNLPYTMTEKSASSAVLDFKPKKVYPYHYRGTDGFSDINAFKSQVNSENSDIEVVLLDWYN